MQLASYSEDDIVSTEDVEDTIAIPGKPIAIDGPAPVVSISSGKEYTDEDVFHEDPATAYQKVGMEDGRVIQAPSDLDGKELLYLDTIQNKGGKADDYINGININIDEDDRGLFSEALGRGGLGTEINLFGSLKSAAEVDIKGALKNVATPKIKGLRDFIFDPLGLAGTFGDVSTIATALYGEGLDRMNPQIRRDLKNFADNKILERQTTLNELDAQAKESDRGWWARNFVKGVEGGYSFLTSIGLALITKNAKISASALTMQTQGSTYIEQTNAGKTPAEAFAVSSKDALSQGIPEYFGLGWSIKAFRGQFRRFEALLVEGANNALQGGSQSLIGDIWNADVRDKTIGDMLWDAGESAAFEGIIGGGTGGVTAGASRTRAHLVADLGKKYNLPFEIADKVMTLVEGTIPKIQEGMQQEIKDLSNPVLNEPELQEQSAEIQRDILDGKVNGEAYVELREAGLDHKEARKIALNDTGVDKGATVKEPKAKSTPESRKQEAQDLIEDAGVVKPTDEKTIKARMKAIDKEISGIDGQLSELENVITERNAQVKSNVAAENRYEKLLNKRSALEDEYGALFDADTTPVIESESGAAVSTQDAAAKDAQGKDIIVKGDTLVKGAQQTARAKQQGVRSGLRTGRRLAKEDVKQAQETVIQAINESDMLPADKAKFLKTIKNANSTEKLLNAMPELESRIARVAESGQLKSSLKKLKTTLKRTRVKKSSGKIKGKYTPETQAKIESIRGFTKQSKEAAAKTLADRQAIETPDVQTQMENTALDIAAGNPVTSQAVKELNDYIKALSGEGRSRRLEQEEKRKAEMAELQAEAIKLLKDRTPKVRKIGAESTLGEGLSIIQRLHEYFTAVWKDNVNMLLGKNSSKKMDKLLDLNENSRIEDEIVARYWVAQIEAVKKAFGISKDWKAKDKLASLNYKKTTVGTFKDARGEIAKMHYTRAQMINWWMKMQDPKNEATFRETSEDKKGMAWTTDMINAATKLDPDEVKFAQAMLDAYNELYKDINEVYKRMEGVDLPFEMFYSPILRDNDGSQEPGDLMSSMIHAGGLNPSAIKSRTDSTLPFIAQSAVDDFTRHLTQMAHYIGYAEKVRDLRRLFSSNKVGSAFIKRYGEAGSRRKLGDINEYIDFFANKNTVRNDAFGSWVAASARLIGRSVLTANPRVAAMQLPAFMAFSDDVNTADFLEGLAAFAGNPKKALEIMRSSRLVNNRSGNFDIDIQSTSKASSKFDVLKRKPSIANSLFILIRYADAGVINLGGYAMYHALTKSGMSHEQAMAEVEKKVAATQQSSDRDQMTKLQRGQFRLLGQFMSGATAVARMELRAVRDVIKGDITKAQFGKKMLIYHVVMPQIFALIASGFEWDDEDQLNALILGSLYGIPVSGELADTIVKKAMGEKAFEPKGLQSPLNKLVYEGLRLGIKKNLKEGEFWDEYKNYSKTLKLVGGATGLPIDTVARQIRGASGLIEGKPHSFPLLLGYSQWAIDNKLNPKPKKSSSGKRKIITGRKIKQNN